jgi:hypothetical protein
MIKTSRKSVWMIAKLHNHPIDDTKSFLSDSPKVELIFRQERFDEIKKTKKDRSDF